jgi:hypothetical protein
MFVPKLTITVPKDSSSVTIADVTGSWPSDATGYEDGLPPDYNYYPQANTQWDKLVTIQALGESPTEYLFSPTTDKTAVTGTVPVSLTDKMWLVTQYLIWTPDPFYTSWDYTKDVTNKILTRTLSSDPWAESGSVPGLLDNVYAIAETAQASTTIDDFNVIVSYTDTECVLTNELTLPVSTAFTLVFRVQKYVLVMNTAEASLISDIGDMSLNSFNCGQGCDSEKSLALFNRMLLKFSAQINASCGNYTKANNAAILFADSASDTSNCSSC